MRRPGSAPVATCAPVFCAKASSRTGAALSKKPGCSIQPPWNPQCGGCHSSMGAAACPEMPARTDGGLEPCRGAETNELLGVVGFLLQGFGNIETKRTH